MRGRHGLDDDPLTPLDRELDAPIARSRMTIPRARTIAGAWIIAGVIALPLALRLRDIAAPSGIVGGSESALVEARLLRDFDSPFQHVAIAVISGLPDRADNDKGRALLRRIVAPLELVGGVGGVISPASSLDTLLIGADGRTAVALIGIRGDTPHVLDSLRIVSAHTRELLLDDAPTLVIGMTGQDAFVKDLRVASVNELRRAELRALPFTIVVAVWAFGSIAAATTAAGIATIAIVVALGITAVIAMVMPVTSFATLVATLVGLALSLDYVLYLGWRRRAGVAPPDVAGQRTVRLAAVLVAVAFAGLTITPTGELRAAAFSGAVVAIVAGLAATTLAPMFRAGTVRPLRSNERWLRWGQRVATRPVISLLSGLAPMILLAAHARTARLETPFDKWLPQEMESVRALGSLQTMGRGSVVGSARVVLTLPEGTPILSPAGWAAIGRAEHGMGALPSAASVRSIATIGTGDLVVAQHVLPIAVKQALISRDGRSALIDVLPDATSGREAAARLVGELRALDANTLTGIAGSRMSIGGLPAYVLDYADATRNALPWVIVVVAIATWLTLVVALRAPIAATKAVVLNLLVALAAVGATVWLFQDGVGSVLLGEPLGSILPTVPLLAFGATFGVSIDYELFLLAAVRERWRAGENATDAAAHGLADVGGLIARAAAVMSCLFFALTASALKPLAMVGFTLGVAVLLDATLVRLVVAPAMMRIAGKWNWWPGDVARDVHLDRQE